MKAIVVKEYGNPNVMQYVDVDMPLIKPKQVLIRVEKTSVNFADVKSRYGKKGTGSLPFIPGIDAAGVIAEVGCEVKHLKSGQRVIAFPTNGSYAEYVVAEENLTFPIPDSIDFDTAASCPIVSFLSYNLLADIAKIEQGETVLIHAAAGGVGTTAIQLAKILGAGKVIGTVGNESKKSIALEAGADHVICYEKGEFSREVNELTDGKGADIILDSVSGWVTEKSLDCLASFGRLVHFGNSSGEVGHIKTIDLHASCRSILGYSLGNVRKNKPDSLLQTANQIFQYLADGSLKITIGKRFILEDARKAHEFMESRQSMGKILLDIMK